MSSPEALWFFVALEELCPDYSAENKIKELRTEFKEEKGNSGFDFLSKPEPYNRLTSALFKSNNIRDSVELLQENNYFSKGEKDLIKNIKVFDMKKLSAFFECLMWAYLDKSIPHDAFEKVIGRTKTNSCSDGETLLCTWVNTIVRKHAKLPILSSINHHFLGQPHLRIVLYNFSLDPKLVKIDDTPDANVKVAMEKANEYGCIAPFGPENYVQQPLLLCCYLSHLASILCTIKPPNTGPYFKFSDVKRILFSIEKEKNQIEETTHRISNLSSEVSSISIKLEEIRRIQSAKQARRERLAATELDEDGRPRTGNSDGKRVTWEMPEEGSNPESGEANQIPQSEDIQQVAQEDGDERLVVENVQNEETS